MNPTNHNKLINLKLKKYKVFLKIQLECQNKSNKLQYVILNAEIDQLKNYINNKKIKLVNKSLKLKNAQHNANVEVYVPVNHKLKNLENHVLVKIVLSNVFVQNNAHVENV